MVARSLFRGPQLPFQMETGRGDPSTAPPTRATLLRLLSWWRGGKRASRDGKWEGTAVEGGRQAALVGPVPRKVGGGSGAGLGWWHLFWVFCRAGPPWVSRAARITRREWRWAYHTILSQHGCASNKAEVTDPLSRHIPRTMVLCPSERWLSCFTQAFSGPRF